jgi:hypothetical protein
MMITFCKWQDWQEIMATPQRVHHPQINSPLSSALLTFTLITDDTINTSEEETSIKEIPRNWRAILKIGFIDSFWSWLSYLPIYTAFNLTLSLNKDAYLIWNNFFGWFLFALAVLGVCFIVWGPIYGLIVVPLCKWYWPRWYEDETSAKLDGDDEGGRA